MANAHSIVARVATHETPTKVYFTNGENRPVCQGSMVTKFADIRQRILGPDNEGGHHTIIQVKCPECERWQAIVFTR